MARKKRLFVVQRAAPRSSMYRDRPTFWSNEKREVVPGTPLFSAASQLEAEAHRAELEREARRTVSFGLYVRHFIPERIKDLLAAIARLGLPPVDTAAFGQEVKRNPEGYGRAYWQYSERVEKAIAAWWEAVTPELTPEANAALWDELYPDHRFYTVVQVPLED
jgi:hypothetical protein